MPKILRAFGILCMVGTVASVFWLVSMLSQESAPLFVPIRYAVLLLLSGLLLYSFGNLIEYADVQRRIAEARADADGVEFRTQAEKEKHYKERRLQQQRADRKKRTAKTP